jgi:HTH-type transcriptional regulator / antitoxin HigA
MIAKANAIPATYFKLVKQFPLIKIRDHDHLNAAFEVIDRLLVMEPDEGRQAYLDALTDLVEVYEDANVVFPDASESDVLRELMDANRLSQTQLAKEVKISQSTISAVLNGSRSLTKEQVTKLARRFNVPTTVFLGS